MWCSKVLVAYDGSAPSAKALHLARSIGAQDESVELVFAHVVKLYGLGTGAETVLLDEAKKVLVEMEQLADEVPNKAHAHLLKGSSPADLLLKCAKTRAATSSSWAAADRAASKVSLAASATPWCRDRL